MAMASFSIGEAYGAGFSLIAKRPLSVIVWGIAYALLTGLPVVLMVVMVGPDFLAGIGELMSVSVSGDDFQRDNFMDILMPAFSRMQAISGLSWITSLVAVGLVHAAIFRAVLRPSDGGFFGMKLGMDEVWQALIYLCVTFLLVILAIGVMLAAALSGAIIYFLGEAVGSPFGGWLQAIGGFAVGVSCVVGIIWICLRFSLAGPATYATKSFQLFESWSVTKGQSWPLLGMALLLFVTLIAFELVIGGIFIGLIVALGDNDALSREAIEAFFQQPVNDWVLQATPWAIGGMLISALVGGAIYSILLAPFASAYRQLTQTGHAA